MIILKGVRNTNGFVVPSKLFDSSASVENYDFGEEFLSEISKYWAGYGQGQIPNETAGSSSVYGHGYYQGERMPSKFYFTQQSGGGSTNSSLSNVFAGVSDNDFGKTPLANKVRASVAKIYFGSPLNGYESDSDDAEGQVTYTL